MWCFLVGVVNVVVEVACIDLDAHSNRVAALLEVVQRVESHIFSFRSRARARDTSLNKPLLDTVQHVLPRVGEHRVYRKFNLAAKPTKLFRFWSTPESPQFFYLSIT